MNKCDTPATLLISEFRVSGNSTKGIPCVQHFSSLVICLWPLHSPKMTMKDHGSYANKTLGRILWSGYRGRSKNLDWTRRREEYREGEQMSDISVTKKVRVWAKSVSRYRCCSAPSLIRPGDSMISQRYKPFASKHPVNKLKKNPLIQFILLQNLWQHPAAWAWSETDKQPEWKKSRKQTNSKPQTEEACRQMCAWRHIEKIPVYLWLASRKSPAHTCLWYHTQHSEMWALHWCCGSEGNRKCVSRETLW